MKQNSANKSAPVKNRSWAFTFILLGIVLMCAMTLVKPTSVGLHNGTLKACILRLEDGQQGVLRDFTPFIWDTAYAFPPYTSKADIEETIGFSSPMIKETVSEGMVHWIFLQNGTLAANVCDYEEDLGYKLDYTGKMLESTPFTASKKDGMTILSITPNPVP